MTKPAARLVFANQARGLAALSVVFSHLVGVYWGLRDFVGLATATPVQAGDPPQALYGLFHLRYLHFGPFGVGLFFLISGLVIPISLAQHSRATFLAARMLRIWPTYVAALLIEMAVVHAAAGRWGRVFPYGDLTVLADALLVHNLVGLPSIDLVNWTLSIEVKFYLLAAALAGPIRRGALGAVFAVPCVVLACDALAALAGTPGATDPPDAIGTLRSEAVFLVFMQLGVLFNYRWRGLLSRPAFVWSIATMLTLFLACWWESPLRGQTRYVLCNYIYALAAFALMFRCRRLFRPTRMLDAVAAISYPLYLVHAVVGIVLLKLLTLDFGLGYLPALAITLVATAGIAGALHALVERPTTALGRSLAAAPAPVLRPPRRKVLAP